MRSSPTLSFPTARAAQLLARDEQAADAAAEQESKYEYLWYTPKNEQMRTSYRSSLR